MVLENASAQDGPLGPESAPSSDIDPYATSTVATEYAETRDPKYLLVTAPGPNAVYVNLDDLPRPVWFHSWEQEKRVASYGILKSCQIAQQALHRPVTQDEADAFAYHLAAGTRIGSFGRSAGLLFTAVQIARTEQSGRWPFWEPFKSGRFSPDKLGPFSGINAQRAWKLGRATAWYIVGATVGQALFGVFATGTSLAARSKDPRLQEFWKAFYKSGQNTRDQRRGLRLPDESDGPRRDETMEMARQRRIAQGAWRNKPQQTVHEDDASPTGGAFQDEYTTSAGDTGLMDDVQARQHVGGRAQPVSDPGHAYGWEDDTRGQAQSSPSRQSSSSKQPQSTWERLRQSAMSGEKPASAPGQRSRPQTRQQPSTGSNPGDTFNFSQSEGEQQLARAEGQKEFDARVERERQGQNSDDGRSGRSRW